jgi:hypothetical protein
VLWRIFGPKRDEVTGEWRRRHNKELYALYSSPNIIRVIKSRRLRWAGHVAHMGEWRGAYRVLVGKSEGRRPLGRPRRRSEDNTLSPCISCIFGYKLTTLTLTKCTIVHLVRVNVDNLGG